MSLTFAEVVTAGLPAMWEYDRGRYIDHADYLPDNLPEERVRLYAMAPRGGYFGGIMFGPSNADAMPDGWVHDEGCRCRYAPRCRAVAV